MNSRASLLGALRAAFLTDDAGAKAAAAIALTEAFAAGRLAPADDGGGWPARPARPERPVLVAQNAVPKRAPGSLRGRIALLHALAHIELNAIDLALDIVGRFHGDPAIAEPAVFAADWLRVAREEAEHFLMLDGRLATLGSVYGALPAHDGLWQAATATAHDLAARLAIAPLVHEARGLDVTPEIIHRLDAAGDVDSARLLTRIAAEEIGHVAIGYRWFARVCGTRGQLPQAVFHRFVKDFHAGGLKPPFNVPARDSAGVPRDFYLTEALRKHP